MVRAYVNGFGRLMDPWRDFDSMNRAISNFFAPSGSEYPAVNVWADGDHAVVTAEIPGIDPGAVDISVVGRSLTLKGSREPVAEKEGESYHRRERRYGHFSRTIELPFTIEANKVEARFSRGVLSITVPRAEADKPRKISVQSN